MIETKELRIGNYVLYKNNEIEVQTIDDGGINEDWDGPVDEGGNLYRIKRGLSYEDIDPIPLTPEWLGRSGFVIETITDSVDDEGDIIKGYTHWTNGKFCFHFSDGKVEGREHIKYLHLFQNWYYFSIGEELTIN